MCRALCLCVCFGVSLLNAASSVPVAVASVAVFSGMVDQSSSVTVLLDFEQPHSPAAFHALERELDLILRPARLKVDLRDKSEVTPGSEFGELLLFKMRGSCTLNALPIGALLDERGPLAMTYSVKGKMLSFGEVECARVRQSIQTVLGKGASQANQDVFGVALARVMAHEMYHMLVKSSEHTKLGLTKESLSGRELSQEFLPLPSQVTNSLRDRFSTVH